MDKLTEEQVKSFVEDEMCKITDSSFEESINVVDCEIISIEP